MRSLPRRTVLAALILFASARAQEGESLPSERGALEALAQEAFENGLARWEASLQREDYDADNGAALECFRLASRAYRQLVEMTPGDLAFQDALVQANTLKYSCLKRQRVLPAPQDRSPAPEGAPSPVPETPAPPVAESPAVSAGEIPANGTPLPPPPAEGGWIVSLTPVQAGNWRRATALIAEANRNLARGEPSRARQKLERAVRLAPWFADGVIALARMGHAAGRERLLREASRRRPEELLRDEAIPPEERKAEELLRSFLSSQEPSAAVWLALGALLEDQHRHADAVDAYTQAIDLDDALAEAYLGRGRAREAVSFFERYSEANHGVRRLAFEDLQRAAELTSDSAEVWARLALSRFMTPETLDRSAAEREVQRSFELVPGYAAAHVAAGMLASHPRHDGAAMMMHLRLAVASDPGLVLAWEYIGAVYTDARFGLRDLKEAEKALRRAVALNPRSFSAWNFLGDVLNCQSRYDEAVLALTAAVTLRRDRSDAVGNRANAYYALGNVRAAAEDARVCLRLDPPQDFRQAMERILADPRAGGR